MSATLEDGCHMYLACGSMINPTSLSLRKLKPVQSWPCKVVGHVRRFWGRGGMAEMFEEEGGSFHSVVHKMTDEDMKTLDGIESAYIRINVTCHLYDGTVVNATGYQFDRSKIEANEAHPPSERYVDIIVQGMEHFGCDPAAIAELRAIEQKPRKRPEEFRTLPMCESPKTFTWEEIVKTGDGLEGRHLYIVLNGKVLQFVSPEGVDPEKVEARKQRELERAGSDLTFLVTSYLYEPKYPLVNSIEEMSEEQRAWAEDMMVDFTQMPPVYLTCVGYVEPYLPVRDRAWTVAQAKAAAEGQ
eukprot:GFYU01002738.1.p1 GENE.GFYU01002738.1~~GFYU01002738.1.p1  ORF type:complete len:300 (-),score=59.01 GFYU01002738.1:198-1097(-)